MVVLCGMYGVIVEWEFVGMFVLVDVEVVVVSGCGV